MIKEQGYSGDEARKIVGITYRQLDYWARTNLIRPSLADASGSGPNQRYPHKAETQPRISHVSSASSCINLHH